MIQFLLGRGVPREEAERIVKESLKERALEIRKEGVRNVLWGGILLAISAVAIITYYELSAVVFYKLVGVLMIPGAYGIYRLMNGIPRLILGRESGSISGMD